MLIRNETDPWFPINHKLDIFDKLAEQSKFGGIMYCPVCGNISYIKGGDHSLREKGNCSVCDAPGRYRQIAHVVCKYLSQKKGLKIRSLSQVARLEGISIYNTETTRAVHKTLSTMKNYACSEYLNPTYKSGSVYNGIMHQDIMNLSFQDASFDIVISSDVFEHVSEPWRGHKEIFRVLKPGGRHVFTVAFNQDKLLNEKRAYINEQGKIVHLLPEFYHLDPLDPKGVLVFNIFGLEMLTELRKIGFTTNLYKLHKPLNGILGNGAIVFEAVKDVST
jgi:hypothetical protein